MLKEVGHVGIGPCDGEPFEVAESHDGGLATEAYVREVHPSFAEIGAVHQMRVTGDDEALLNITLVRAAPDDSGDAAIFLRPDVAFKDDHFTTLRRHELLWHRDRTVVHGESLRLGIEYHGLTRECAIWLQVRPTRRPEDATIGEAHEFLR